MDNDRKAVYDYIMNADGLIKMSTFAIFDGVVNKDYVRSEEHTSELQSRRDLVCRLLLEKKKCWSIRAPAPAKCPRPALRHSRLPRARHSLADCARSPSRLRPLLLLPSAHAPPTPAGRFS